MKSERSKSWRKPNIDVDVLKLGRAVLNLGFKSLVG